MTSTKTNRPPTIHYMNDGYLSLSDIVECLRLMAELNLKHSLGITSGIDSLEEIKANYKRVLNIPSDSLYMAADLLASIDQLSKRPNIVTDERRSQWPWVENKEISGSEDPKVTQLMTAAKNYDHGNGD